MSKPTNWQFDILAPFYDWITDGFLFQRPWKFIFEKLEIKNEQSILDLGGGTGRLSERLRRRNENAALSIFVCDFNFKMLTEGKKKRTKSDFVKCDALKLPFQQNKFDKVFIGDALHHMSSPGYVLQEVNRVLHPGGTLLVEEFNPDRFMGQIIYYVEKLSAMRSTFYTPENLSRIISENGLTLEGHWEEKFRYYIRASSS